MNSVLVATTLDLVGIHGKQNPRATYEKVRLAHKRHGLLPSLRSRKRENRTPLPYNTYAGTFRLKPGETASSIRRSIQKSLVAELRRIHPRIHLLVVCGERWSWGKRRFH